MRYLHLTFKAVVLAVGVIRIDRGEGVVHDVEAVFFGREVRYIVLK